MSVDVAAKTFQFGFAPHLTGQCGNPEGEAEGSSFLQSLLGQVSEMTIQDGVCNRVSFENFAAEFPGLFS